MMRIMAKGKLHRATITDANLLYEGSLTVDPQLMELADLLPHERVQVVNINNGFRGETYVIPGRSGSGVICANGALARHAEIGDKVIIISYGWMEDAEARSLVPRFILLDEQNRPILRSVA